SVKARGGTWTLAWGGMETAALPWDASAQTVETALAAVTAGAAEVGRNPMVVTRMPYRNGYRFTVVWMAWRGNVGLLVGDDTLLEGDAPYVTVTEKMQGMADIRPGDFT
ncbi:unnamed protein product, partial [Phaeothamnion confervicola]